MAAGSIRYTKRLDDAGEWVETPEYLIDGRVVSKAQFDAEFPDHEIIPGTVPIGHQPGAWPLESVALACHPKQVQAMNERNARNGVSTRYKPDGTAVIPDRGDRKKLLRLEGLHDNNGFARG